MSAIRIVADENIPFVTEVFSRVGQVYTYPGREIDQTSVRDAQLLLVRSVTQVGHKLLDGSSVRFVATATAGTDHIDLGYLSKRGIAFASASGSNANSVSEYLVAALLVVARRGGFQLEGKTIGVIGVGNVGSRVVKKMHALGMRVLQNDPPLARQTGEPHFLPLEALFEADFITLHVPLTYESPYATYHLVSESFLAHMKPGSILINTSRGAVVDEKSLHRALDSGHLRAAVLDVWENEPAIDVSLLDKVTIGTPHIAGYSLDGKVNGTIMLYRAACEFLGLKPDLNLVAAILPQSPCSSLEVRASNRDDEDVLREVVLRAYDIERDDRALRKIVKLPVSDRGRFFDWLRKEYPIRREFSNTQLTISNAHDGLRQKFVQLGFFLT